MGTSTATRPVRPVTRLDALREIANDSSRAAFSTRALVAGDTVDSPRRVRETVEGDTPARWATSASVAPFATGSPTMCGTLTQRPPHQVNAVTALS
ncbi:hypothetical protein GCM10010451_47240 [Streptomyces virens]|uniref:Uncharacterized protein n=1 Tax=Streptomyces virens TaxID=285572 RepID=A0ABP6PVR9_9ACTN